MRIRSRSLKGVGALVSALLVGLAPVHAADKVDVQQQLARASELMRSGKPAEALAATDAALAQADAEGRPGPIVAVLTMRLGLQNLQRDFPAGEASARRAFELAEQLGGPGVMIGALVALNATMLQLQWGRPAHAEPWARRAVAGAQQADRNGRLHEATLGFLGLVAEAQGHHAAAQQLVEQELALAEKQAKRNLQGEATSLMRLGDLRDQRGDAAGAREAYARALERQLARAESERSASDWARLARVYRVLGRAGETQAALDRAQAAVAAAGEAAALEASTSPEALAKRRAASEAVFAWRDIGRVERDRGRPAEAESAFRRALAMSERMDGPGNANLPAMQVELGDLLRLRTDWAGAEAVYAGTLASLDKTAGGTAAHLPEVLQGMAQVLLATGRPADAEAAVRREIRLYDGYYASDHPRLAPALDLLAEVLVADGRGDEARPLQTRAAAIREIKR